jgi:hypothetical protein
MDSRIGFLALCAFGLVACAGEAPDSESIVTVSQKDESGPAFKSISTSINSTTVDAPAGVTEGDFLIAALEDDTDPADITPPSGWTRLANVPAGPGSENPAIYFHALVYTHVATSSEPSTYTFASSSGAYVDVQVAAYTGVSSVDTWGEAAESFTSIRVPAVTPSSSNDLFVVFLSAWDFGVWSTVPGMTARSNVDANSIQDQVLSSSATVGGVSVPDTVSFSPSTAVSILLH